MPNIKNKKRQTRILSQSKLKTRLTALFVAGFVAVIGTTFIIQSRAATSEAFVIASDNIVQQGDTVTMELAVQNIPAGSPYHIILDAGLSGTQGLHPYFTSCSVSNCIITQEVGGSQASSSARSCVVLPQTTTQQTIGKLSFKLVSSEAYNLVLSSPAVYRSADCSNSTEVVSYPNYLRFIVRNGGAPINADCFAGFDVGEGNHCPGFNAPGETSNTEPNGNNSNTNGDSGGGAKAKSVSTKQSDQTSSLPASSPQGDSNQLTVYPSPFYDGKEYNSGSDAKEIFGISVSGQTLRSYWLLFVGLVMAAAAGAVFGLRWWRDRKVAKTKKRK